MKCISLQEKLKMEKKQRNEFVQKFTIIFPIGLLAISFFFLQALLSSRDINVARFISIVLFSLTIPLLALEISVRRYWMFYGYRPVSKLHTFICHIMMINLFIVIAALITCLWGISWIFGLIFLLSSVFALVLIVLYSDQYDSIENALRPKAEIVNQPPQQSSFKSDKDE